MSRPRLLCMAMALGAFSCTFLSGTTDSLVSEARGQDAPSHAELEQARHRFAAARKLEDKGEWAEALELFEQVGKVRMTPQVRFHIALCQEHLGMLTKALKGYVEAQDEATPQSRDVVKESKEHIAELEKRIPTLTIDVSGSAEGDRLELDQQQIAMGNPAPLRVDPGSHLLEVRRNDEVVARAYFEVAEGTTRRVELRVPAPAAKEPVVVTPPAEPPNRSNGLQRTLGWGAIGVGAASVVAAGVFIGLRGGAVSDVDDACPSHSGCDPSLQDTVDRGETYATLVNVFAIAGVVGIAGGTVLVLTAPSNEAPPNAPTARFRPIVSPSLVGLAGEGRF